MILNKLRAWLGLKLYPCECICHDYPGHHNLQDALEALRWYQEELKLEKEQHG